MSTLLEAETIKSALFRYLSKVEGPTKKETRDHLEKTLGYQPGTFKQEKYWDYVKEFAAQFLKQKNYVAKQQSSAPLPSSPSNQVSSPVSIRKPNASEENHSSDYEDADNLDQKKGKFSMTESKIIKKTLKSYAREHGMQLKELAPHYREEKKKFPELYERLMALLPNRSRKALQQHAVRLIEQEDKDLEKLTEQDKEQLKELVKIHGNDFRKIAKIMGKRREACKHAFQRLNKVNRGRFTVDEDNQIIAAVRNVTMTEGDELPTEGIPWKEVAQDLKNYRHADDYCRRWLVILSKIKSKPKNQQSFATSQITAEDHQSRNENETNSKLLRLLHYLRDSDASDETEIIWTQVDAKLGIYQTEALFKRAVRKHLRFSPTDLLFQDQIEELIEIYRILVEKESKELNEAVSSPTPQKKIATNSSSSLAGEVPQTEAKMHYDSDDSISRLLREEENHPEKPEQKASDGSEKFENDDSQRKEKKKKKKRKSSAIEEDNINNDEPVESSKKKKSKRRKQSIAEKEFVEV